MSHTHLLHSARHAGIAALLIVALGVTSFLAFEPTLSRGQTSNPHNFTVTQQITNEISFLVEAADVTMTGSIAGLTGGYATGTTVVSVNTNNATGYNMTLAFSNTIAMQASSTAYINNYTPASVNVPDYDWIENAAGQAAEFGYTVRASSSNEIDASFKNNGTLCNTGSSETDNKCWLNPSTTPETIINSVAPNGSSTTTIKFKVAVPSNPSPALPSAYYVATGTLTATTN